MMRTYAPHLTVWRLVLEAQTPLSVVTGRGDNERDTVLATDANGLPFIPGSSMAGAVRALVRSSHPQWEHDLFGHLEGPDRQGSGGAMSRIEFSHACIHDSSDHPVTGLRESITDPLLEPLLHRRNAQRQRVRINHRGTADEGGLFDRSVLPAGHRFTVEWAMWSDQPDDEQEAVLGANLHHGHLKVGGLTRSGLGWLRVVRWHGRRFDLRRREDLSAFSALPTDLAGAHNLPIWEPNKGAHVALGELRRVTLQLHPEGAFHFGGGTRSLSGAPSPRNAARPMSEPRVTWNGSAGALDTHTLRALLPATGLKGALSHRVAFHANRLSGSWARPPASGRNAEEARCPSAQRLFGTAAGEEEVTVSGGHAGVVSMPDAWLEPKQLKVKTRMHNHIDRFTGGVRDGLLFGVEELHATSPSDTWLTWSLTLDLNRWRALGGQDLDMHALQLAIEDLCEGRLALGADSAGGLGFFKGRADWDGDGLLPSARRTDSDQLPQGASHE